MADGANDAKRRHRPDGPVLLIAFAMLAMAAVVVVDVQRVAGLASYSRVSPAAFPYGVAAGLVVLGLLTAVAAFRRTFPPRTQIEIVPVLWIVGGVVVQIALLHPAGFSVATGFLFAMTARAFGRGRLIVTVPIGTVFALILYLILNKSLQLSLPTGFLERLF